MAKHKRKARRALGQTSLVTYDYSSGSKKIVGLSKAGKWTVGLIAAGALAWLLWPKGPKASEATKKAVEGAKANAAKTGSKYTIQKGDSWSKIAEKTYGDYRWWPALWDANRVGARFMNPDMVRVGEVVVVPALPTSDESFKNVVFARAEAEKNWAADKAKAAAAKKPFKAERPKAFLEATPIPASGQGVLPVMPAPQGPVLPVAPAPTGPVLPPSTEDQMNALEAEMKKQLPTR